MSDSATRTCPKCQRQTPVDRDFCVHCRAYQNFEATIVVPTVSKADPPIASDEPPARAHPAPRPSPRPPPPVEPAAHPEPGPQPTPARRGDTLVAPAARARGGRARLDCRRVDGEYTGESVIIGVPAGGEGRVVVLVENRDDIVDTYELSVVGLPGGWWSIEPSIVRLFPAGKVDRSRGDQAKQEVEIVIRPPRSSEATARRWPAQIVAESREYHDQAASEAFAVDVEPFHAFATDAVPTRASGRRHARLHVHVANTGNTPLAVELHATDPEAILHYAFEPDRLTVAPGDRATSLLTVRPPRPIIVGRAVERPFTVVADAAAAPPAQSIPVAFRHRAWIPRWVLTVVPLLLLALLAAWLAFPRLATVPNLTGLTPFQADQVLAAHGLERGTVESVTLPNGKGRVIKQKWPPGKRLRKGSKVDIYIALGTQLAPVPNVLKQLEPAAVQQLQARGFSVADVVGGGEKPELTRVVKQDPPPNAQRRQGTPVTLTVKPESASSNKAATGSTRGKAVGAAVPAGLAGLTAGAAIAALNGRGLEPVIVREISASVSADKVIQTTPKPGAAASNGTVTLYVSAGYPEIAYQHSRTIVVARGTDGGQVAQLRVGIAAQNSDPSWGPDGRWLVFRRGDDTQGQIWRADIPGLSHVTPLTAPGHQDDDPAVSPDGRVVAFVRDGSQLCFVGTNAHAAPGSCRDAETTINRPAWAPDGRTLLALAAANGQIEVEQFTTRHPSSARAADWQPGALITNGLHGDRPDNYVASVALAPTEPPRIALTANWGADVNQYTLRLGPADADGTPAEEPKPLKPSVTGCEVAWRSDGRELAVAFLSSCTRDAPGPILLVNPANGQSRQLPGVSGTKPAFQPIPLGP